jgi:hypothetical protein
MVSMPPHLFQLGVRPDTGFKSFVVCPDSSVQNLEGHLSSLRM